MFKLLIQHITSDMVITLLLLSSLHFGLRLHEKRKPLSEVSHNGSLYCTRPSRLYSILPACAMVSIAIWWQIFAQSNEVSLKPSQSSDSLPVSEREGETQRKSSLPFTV